MKRLNCIAGYSLLVFLVFTGCKNKELCPQCEQEAGVEIEFDWSDVEKKPEGMTVLFYNMENELMYTLNNVPPAGETIHINAGTYRVACYNNDSEYEQWHEVSNMDSMYVETRVSEELKASDKLPQEDLVECPDFLCGAILQKKELFAYSNETQIVLLKPEPLLCHYTYSVSNIENGEYIEKTSATLSGLSRRYYLSHPEHQLGTITMPFEDNLVIDGQHTGVGSMLNFGELNLRDNHNYLTLYIWSKGGNFRAIFDVTDQVMNAPDPKNVHIVIDTKLVVPPPIGGGDGLEPSVDEWEDVYYDIIL